MLKGDTLIIFPCLLVLALDEHALQQCITISKQHIFKSTLVFPNAFCALIYVKVSRRIMKKEVLKLPENAAITMDNVVYGLLIHTFISN